ncbi:hypothetical protein SCHPADRAFT_923523 [Schizopora paradoxa]|uniref:Uncharacterized protein n=1 Tax=Schizopora paradoxa TaxID=27342 RepID=A0A0H2S7T5_9AGAM|nr:hypothetical protein SCHPADRAFT_923523 [Schizopora paradoxa]
MEKGSKKRKREEEAEVVPPRITYVTPSKTFERLFRETSLNATKELVRKKLGLGEKDVVELSQVRDGRVIDLEDDDDFDAFRVYANFSKIAEVKVQLPGSSSQPATSLLQVESNGSGSSTKKNAAEVPNGSSASKQQSSETSTRKVTFDETEGGKPKSKKKRDSKASLPNKEAGLDSSSTAPGNVVKAKVVPTVLNNPAPAQPDNTLNNTSKPENISRKKRRKKDASQETASSTKGSADSGESNTSSDKAKQKEPDPSTGSKLAQSTKISSQKKRRRRSSPGNADDDGKEKEEHTAKKQKTEEKKGPEPKAHAQVEEGDADSALNNAIAAVLRARMSQSIASQATTPTAPSKKANAKSKIDSASKIKTNNTIESSAPASSHTGADTTKTPVPASNPRTTNSIDLSSSGSSHVDDVSAATESARSQVPDGKTSKGNEDDASSESSSSSGAQETTRTPLAKGNASTPRPIPPKPSLHSDFGKSDTPGRPMLPLSHHAKPSPSQVKEIIQRRIPSGSVISEVAVQSRNEGSSSESEVSDGSDSDSERTLNKRKQSPRASSPVLDLQSSLEATSAADLLKTLMPPPTQQSLNSILNSFDGDSDTPEKETEEDDEDDEEQEERSQRRLSQNIFRSRSPSAFPSDDEDGVDAKAGDVEEDSNEDEMDLGDETFRLDRSGTRESEDISANNDGAGIEEDEGAHHTEKSDVDDEIGEVVGGEGGDPVGDLEDGAGDPAEREDGEKAGDEDGGSPSHEDQHEDLGLTGDDVDTDNSSEGNNTPTMKDVNDRAESYISEHVANCAVSDAMAKDTAFLEGNAPVSSQIDQLDGDDSDSSTKVDLSGAGARIEDVASEVGMHHETQVTGNRDPKNSNVDGNPSNSGPAGTHVSSPTEEQSVEPSSRKAPILLQTNDTPTPGRVKRMRGKNGLTPAALDATPKTITAKAVAASNTDDVVDAPEPSRDPPRRYNTRRSVAAINQPLNSQTTATASSKPSKSTKKSSRLKVVAEEEQNTRIPESRQDREPVVEITVRSRALNTPELSRSSPVVEESPGPIAQNGGETIVVDARRRKSGGISSSSAEIESSLVPKNSKSSLDSSKISSPEGLPSPTTSPIDVDDDAEAPNSSPPPPPRQMTHPRLSLKQNYRSLQELASSQDLFLSSASQSKSFALTPVKSFDGEIEDDDEDEEEESSDSDTEMQPKKPILNIPKEKMAGKVAPHPQEKKRSLLSMYF